MSSINLEAFRRTPLNSEPFPYLTIPKFVRSDVYATLSQDFPVVTKPGSFPVSELSVTPTFEQFLGELRSTAVTQAFATKFDVDLAQRPTMITIRGMCRAKDGKIHSDSRSKLLTVLIYMNDIWPHKGGRLRLLRSVGDLNDMITEVEPGPGTMVAFLNTDSAWHGHTQYNGQRRAIQLNWVTDEGVVKREQGRHRFSAKIKKLNPFV